MKIHRFFIFDEIVGGEYVVQDEALVHQMARVLRLHVGDTIILCTADGIDYVSEIVTIEKKYVDVRVLEQKNAWVPETSVVLYCAIIRKELFELVLQKATEIGVARIIPLTTERTERGSVSRIRAEKIMREASEQCGRGDIPIYGAEQSLHEVLRDTQGGKNLCMFDREGSEMPSVLSQNDTFGILIGPEGGWSPAEKRLFAQHACPMYTLGPTTLRAETAAIVACGLIQRALRS